MFRDNEAREGRLGLHLPVLHIIQYLDLGLDVGDRVGRLDVERDRLARQGLDKDLPARLGSRA